MEAYPTERAHWATDLAFALLRESSLRELIQTALAFLPPISFDRLLLFCVRSYPRETAAPLSCILRENAGIEC